MSKKFSYTRGFLIIVGVFLCGFAGMVYSIGFHTANEIFGGVFLGDYSFNGEVDFNDNVDFNSSIVVTGNADINGSMNTKGITVNGPIIIDRRTSDPVSPVEGQIWLRTDI